MGGGASDCPSNGTITCPYFDRIKIASDGKISTDKWAYYPVQKKWIALSARTISQHLNFASSDTTFDGASWSTESILLSPKSQIQAAGPWLYSYGNGNVEYELKLTGSAIAGQAITGAPNKTYPSDAKSATLWFEQNNGVFYTLKKGGFWSSNRESSDDGKQYTNVAALRAAHIATSTPLCLANFDTSALIYFDSTMHAAGISNVSGICRETIKSADKITAVQSGVITLANRPVIVAQIPDDLFSSNTPAREKQILAIVGLNAVGGNAANGLAYLPGYTKTLTGYQNQAAFKAWLNTVATDTEAQTLP
uniref:Uncharacterized protein n=1 Tax=uncultured organism TaxID=155900 RepID=D8VN57_9ZZZZ|nr:hypothetical protein [uncultured organism]